jgi:hypothetical protein
VATPVCTVPPATPDVGRSVADALHRRCDVVITGELARLARRSPRLGAHELDVVSTSIRRVVERLLLDRVPGRSFDEHLVELFDLEET